MQGSGSRGDSPTTSLVGHARAAWMGENRAAGERLTACYALFRACDLEVDAVTRGEAPPGHAVVESYDVCCAHLVEAFAISSRRAARMITLAVDLTERFPAVLAALVEGRLDQRAAELLARQLQTVDPAVLARVQQEVVDAYLAAIEGGERPGEGAVCGMIDEIIRRHDADGIRLRREDASRDRGVSVSKGRDGMSMLWATLAADEAAVLAERLDQIAETFTGNGNSGDGVSDPGEDCADMSYYSVSERRADALMSLACDGGGARRGAGPADESDPLRPEVTVIASADGSEAAVQFPRTGESAMAALLAMLSTGSGATLRKIDPTIGAADDARRALDYRPPAALARAVRLRDGMCRHPGCTVAAEYCDLDHVVPFDRAAPSRGGRTEERNLICLCRRHHRFKTFADWRCRMRPDGTLVVTSPGGSRMHTRPDGPLARYRRAEDTTSDANDTANDTAKGASAGPVPASEPTPEPDFVPTYWHRRSQRLRAERRTVAANNARPSGRTRDRPKPRATGATGGTGTTQETSIQEQRLTDLLYPPPF